MSKVTISINKLLYNKVANALTSHKSDYMKCISKFIEDRHEQLYDPLPCDRLYFKDTDVSDLFNALKLDIGIVKNAIEGTYYYPISNFNPRAAKDECTVVMLCIVKYFASKRMQKELELALIHISFSGKFYPSIHYAFYPTTPPSQYRHIMEYCVNHEMSNKYEIKVAGSTVGAVRSIAQTWVDSYKNRFNRFTDEDVVYLIQQLHGRIKSMTKNIASLYYEIYKDKDKYMSYDTENLEDGSDFRMNDSDSLMSERIVERGMSSINTKDVDYKVCHAASDNNVRTEEVKGIIQSIVTDPEEQKHIKELLGIMVSTYMVQSNTKDINDIKFIVYSTNPTPNTKDPNILRKKEIVEDWLTKKSERFNRRRNRKDTENSYKRAVLSYFGYIE